MQLTTENTLTAHKRVIIKDEDSGITVTLNIPESIIFASQEISQLVEDFIAKLDTAYEPYRKEKSKQ